MSVARSRGLVVGKFLPPHGGHHHVIDRALEECDEVDVVVCDRQGQRPPASERAVWLSEVHPGARVMTISDICGWHGEGACPPRCSREWAKHLRENSMGPWDVVYGSEAYVLAFGDALGARPCLVDVERVLHPVSGSAIRADLAGNWGSLHPTVRAGLVRRIVVLGAESTGSTTLAGDLAQSLRVPCVSEYGRQLSAERAVEAGSIWKVTWSSADFDLIAERQVQLEANTIRSWVGDPVRSAPKRLGPLVVCDTDVLATTVWHRRYCGSHSEELVQRAFARPPLLYVLTSPAGVPFVQDGLRDGEHLRDEMTSWFRDVLGSQPTPWVEVAGGPQKRLAMVMEVLEPLARLPVLVA